MDNEQDKTSICENDEKDSDEIGAETNNSNISKRQLKRMKKRELWLEKRKEKRFDCFFFLCKLINILAILYSFNISIY